MGQLIDGAWTEGNVLSNHDAKGLYFKRPSVFRNRVSAEPDAEFPAESGRYHLYCAVACPWAHRATLFRVLKKLEPHIALWNTAQEVGGQGWSFGPEGHVVPGVGKKVRWLHEIYQVADPGCTTRVTVPTLWDAKTKRIVNNEFLRDHPHVQRRLRRTDRPDARLLPRGLAPRDRRDQCAGAQGHQQRRQRLRLLDHPGGLRRLARAAVRRRSTSWRRGCRASAICADAQQTEADWRLFPSLVRFDAIYYVGLQVQSAPARGVPQPVELSSRALSDARHRRRPATSPA